MTQTQEVRGVQTAVFTDKRGVVRVIYRGTCVVEFDTKRVILNTGGWFTATTKTRMNQAANEYGLGFSVYQKAREWFVSYHGKEIPFSNPSIELKR